MSNFQASLLRFPETRPALHVAQMGMLGLSIALPPSSYAQSARLGIEDPMYYKYPEEMPTV